MLHVRSRKYPPWFAPGDIRPIFRSSVSSGIFSASGRLPCQRVSYARISGHRVGGTPDDQHGGVSMDSTLIAKPQPGQSLIIPGGVHARLVLDFNPVEANLERLDQDLVFRFDDGSHITLENFYANAAKYPLPDFVVMDDVISGKDFFAALSEELQPAAGPAAAMPKGGRFHEFGEVELVQGVEALQDDVLEQNDLAGMETVADTLVADTGPLSAGAVAASGRAAAGPSAPGVDPESPVPPVPPAPPILHQEYAYLKDVGVHNGNNDTSHRDGVDDIKASFRHYNKDHRIEVSGKLNDGKNDDFGKQASGESNAPVHDASVTYGLDTAQFDTEGYKMMSYLNWGGTPDQLTYKDSVDPENPDIMTLHTNYGVLTLNASTGEYTFALNIEAGGAVDKLPLGSYVKLHLPIKAINAAGESVTSTIEVKIVGTNDKPTLELQHQDGTAADSTVIVETESTKGIIKMTDHDQGDTHTYTISSAKEAMTFENLAAGKGNPGAIEGRYGTLTFNPATGEYMYTLRDGALADNAAGPLQDEFKIHVQDRGKHQGRGDPTGASDEITITFDVSQKLAEAESLQNESSLSQNVVEADAMTTAAAAVSVLGFEEEESGLPMEPLAFSASESILGAENSTESAAPLYERGEDFLFGSAENEIIAAPADNVPSDDALADGLPGGMDADLDLAAGSSILNAAAMNDLLDGGWGAEFLGGLADLDNLDKLLGPENPGTAEILIFNGDTDITSLEQLKEMGVTVNENGGVNFSEDWRVQVDQDGNTVEHNGYVIMEHFADDSLDMQIAVQQALLSEGHG